MTTAEDSLLARIVAADRKARVQALEMCERLALEWIPTANATGQTAEQALRSVAKIIADSRRMFEERTNANRDQPAGHAGAGTEPALPADRHDGGALRGGD